MVPMKKVIYLIFVTCLPFLSNANGKPNILFFLADDLGWTDLKSYGSTFYESPNLDKLASEGLKFTQSYCAGSVLEAIKSSSIK
jgi:hypothetical protein